ncbi:hypothetical protein [Treponema sp.]|uniref:hypothetical protein n=1 Tax=Treponema sp. TaxID=166 RepID=UPI003F014A47
MIKKHLFSIKFIIFIAIFFLLSGLLSTVLINDVNAYTRVLMHEFYNQERIDVLFCGASHVSHGINSTVADKKLAGGEYRSFSTGTPSQSLNGTYAILREAIRLYDLKDVFVELDFATATTSLYSKSEPSKSTFLVAHYLQNPAAKIEYLAGATSPKYYLNSLLPIGKEKLIDLNPASVLYVLKSKISGEYYKYQYKSDDSVYAGKGCVLDDEVVEEGSLYSEPVNPIPVKDISREWKETVLKIIRLCDEKKIRLCFYQNPSTNFYLLEKQNYDEYIAFIREILCEYDVPYYDFSLLKPEYLDLCDSDFFDDNHLNKYGIEKFTNIFCDFYNKSETERLEMFFSTYSEKLSLLPPKIYGHIIEEDKENASFSILPVMNNCDDSLVEYDVTAYSGGKEIPIARNSSDRCFYYPENSSGKIKVISYYDKVQQTSFTKYYSAL